MRTTWMYRPTPLTLLLPPFTTGSWQEAKHPEAKVEGAEIVVLEEVHDCEGWGCEHEEPAEGWKYAECEGKEVREAAQGRADHGRGWRADACFRPCAARPPATSLARTRPPAPIPSFQGCHVATADACVLPNYHCVDGLSFCLGDKVMACAAGTVCSTRAYTSFNISPCVHPWQAK